LLMGMPFVSSALFMRSWRTLVANISSFFVNFVLDKFKNIRSYDNSESRLFFYFLSNYEYVIIFPLERLRSMDLTTNNKISNKNNRVFILSCGLVAIVLCVLLSPGQAHAQYYSSYPTNYTMNYGYNLYSYYPTNNYHQYQIPYYAGYDNFYQYNHNYNYGYNPTTSYRSNNYHYRY
jgi:hypothetical protein